MEIKEKLMELKSALETEEKINGEISAKRLEFEEHNKLLFLKQTKVRETITECKGVLSTDAEAGFRADGLKKRFGGIGIRVGELLIYNEKTAFDWAKVHQLCLNLNKKEFEKIAKTQEIDFVKKEEKITVTFPSIIKLEDEEK